MQARAWAHDPQEASANPRLKRFVRYADAYLMCVNATIGCICDVRKRDGSGEYLTCENAPIRVYI